MRTPSPADRYVTLRPCFVVPVEPWLLLLDLEARGCRFERSTDGQVVVRPGRLLTDEDRAALARWSRHITALVAYVDDEHWQTEN